MESPIPDHHPSLEEIISFEQALLQLSPNLNKANISLAQYLLLSRLSTVQNLKISDLCKTLGHSTAAAWGVIDRLERLGYIEKPPHSDRRREAVIKITTQGERLTELAHERLLEIFAEPN